MALFSVTCPSCHRLTLINGAGYCQNTLKNGNPCGFAFPIQFDSGNHLYRGKFQKHTNPPAPGASGKWSWTSSSGNYEFHQQWTLESGSLALDPQSNYLFLFGVPQGANSIASLFYADAGTVSQASGTILPLNSKPQNFHHHYDNWQPHFQHIVEGSGVTIEAPNTLHADYRVFRDSTLIYTYDQVSRSGQRFGI